MASSWRNDEEDEKPEDRAVRAAVATLPKSVAFDYDVLPLRFENGILRVMVARRNEDVLEKVKFAARCQKVDAEIGPIDQIREGLNEAYPTEIEEDEPDSNAPKVFQSILDEAVRRHAGDVFIEPANQMGEGRCRLAIYGVLRTSERYGRIRPTMFSRLAGLIKTKGNVLPNNPNLPGDGRMTVMAEGREVDLRISTMPIGNHSRICMRLLSSMLTLRDLEELGMNPIIHKKFRGGISRPGAFVTIAGPTGEGKSTTAYSGIWGLDREQLNVCSIENPIECYIDGVMQIPIAVEQAQASTAAQMTFAQAARALLRQYPHFIFLGEMRDAETVEIAMLASTTGISLLTTVHATDAIKTILRLEALGANRQQLAQSMTMATSQRLLRRLCESCKKPAKTIKPKAAKIADLFGIDFQPGKVFQANLHGCESCKGTGYFDRVGAFEILEFSPDIKDALEANEPIGEVAHIAVEKGYRPMAVSGLEHVANGMTDEREMMRVLPYEDALAYVRPETKPPSIEDLAA